MKLWIFAYIAIWLGFTSLFLFVPAADWRWPAGWAFMVEFAAASYAVTIWLARHDPRLLAERLKPPIQRDQEPWDRAFMVGMLITFYGWFALIALDARRYRWSTMPAALQMLGAVLIAVCFIVTWLSFKENSYAAPVVKIQTSRGQQVVSTGPYGLVRHPMYSGAVLLFVGAPLMLGSWWGLAATPVFIFAIGARAVGEERALRFGLEGYAAYAAKVRFRLVPFVW